MKNKLKTGILVAGITIVSMAAASAHVEFNPDTVPANKLQVLTINVPHDCTVTTKTLEVKLQIPSAVDTSTFKSVGVFQHGSVIKTWTESIVKIGTKSYLDIKGPATQAGPDMGPNAMDMKFKLKTPAKPGTQLKWPAVQSCTGGQTIQWIQPRPADGSDPAMSAHPLAVLNLK